MFQLAIYWPLQLTYPIERWPVPRQLENDERRKELFTTMLEEGTVVAACEKLGMSRGMVYYYATQNAKFREELNEVRAYLGDVLRDEALRMADEGYRTINDSVKANLLGTVVRAKLAASFQHKPSQPVQVNVDNRQVNIEGVSDPERARLIEMRRKALENHESKQSNN